MTVSTSTIICFLEAQSIMPPNSLNVYPSPDRLSEPFANEASDVASKTCWGVWNLYSKLFTPPGAVLNA